MGPQQDLDPNRMGPQQDGKIRVCNVSGTQSDVSATGLTKSHRTNAGKIA